MSKTVKLENVNLSFLKAWADAGVISVREYIDEMKRRGLADG